MKWGNPGCAVKQCNFFALSMAKSELVLGLYHHWQHAYTQFGYPPNLRKKTPGLQNTSPGPVEERRSGASCFTGQVPELLQTLMSVNGGAPGTSLRQDRGAVVNRFPSNASELDWGNDLLAEFSSEFLNSSLN